MDAPDRADGCQSVGFDRLDRSCAGRGLLRAAAAVVDVRVPLRLPRRPAPGGAALRPEAATAFPSCPTERPRLHVHDPASAAASASRTAGPSPPPTSSTRSTATWSPAWRRLGPSVLHDLVSATSRGDTITITMDRPAAGPAGDARLDALLRDPGRPARATRPDGADGRAVLHREQHTERDRPQAQPELPRQPSPRRCRDRLDVSGSGRRDPAPGRARRRRLRDRLSGCHRSACGRSTGSTNPSSSWRPATRASASS